MTERIYDTRHDFDPDHVVHIEVDDAGNFCLIALDGDQQATVKLDANGARALRLAAQRFERSAT